MKTTLPGSTLRELGEKFTCPTPPTASGWLSIATVCTISMMRAMARPALTRMFIGVEPVWASLPVRVNSQPPQALAVGDDADLLVLGLEDRALLDVVFEIGVHLARADLFVADPADALQLVAEVLAVRVRAAIGVVERVHAGEDAGGQHGRGEARAFLVGPVGDDDRMPGLDAEIVERADHFEAASTPSTPS